MVELLITEFIIERNIRNMVYLWSGGCLVLFLIILWRMGLTRRALWAVGISFIINIGWEISLFLTDARAFESGFPFLLEFIYHGFTELAPFVLFWMICLKLFGFIGNDEESGDSSSNPQKHLQHQDAERYLEDQDPPDVGSDESLPTNSDVQETSQLASSEKDEKGSDGNEGEDSEIGVQEGGGVS